MLVGEERGLFKVGGGESLVVGVRGGAVRVPLIANVFLTLLLLVKLLLLYLLPLDVLFLVLVILIIRS